MDGLGQLWGDDKSRLRELLDRVDGRAFPVTCPRCGFDLRATGGSICSECGTTFDKPELLWDTYGEDALAGVADACDEADEWDDVDWWTTDLQRIRGRDFPVSCPACQTRIVADDDILVCPSCKETRSRRLLLWLQYGPDAFVFGDRAASSVTSDIGAPVWPRTWIRLLVVSGIVAVPVAAGTFVGPLSLNVLVAWLILAVWVGLAGLAYWGHRAALICVSAFLALWLAFSLVGCGRAFCDGDARVDVTVPVVLWALVGAVREATRQTRRPPGAC